MEAAVLNPTQMHLLKLFAFNKSEEYAREVQMVLMHYFQEKLDEESNRLWESGVLDQDRLNEIRHMDLHAKQWGHGTIGTWHEQLDTMRFKS